MCSNSAQLCSNSAQFCLKLLLLMSLRLMLLPLAGASLSRTGWRPSHLLPVEPLGTPRGATGDHSGTAGGWPRAGVAKIWAANLATPGRPGTKLVTLICVFPQFGLPRAQIRHQTTRGVAKSGRRNWPHPGSRGPCGHGDASQRCQKAPKKPPRHRQGLDGQGGTQAQLAQK